VQPGPRRKVKRNTRVRSTVETDADLHFLFCRAYTKPSFAAQLVQLLRDDLSVAAWADLPRDTDPSQLSISKVSGALTNSVFFVSHSTAPVPTVLLRIYGPSSGSLISRKTELHILHTLSSRYGIGPSVLGTFANGRVEEHFASRALTKEELRDPRISRWIARRMKELHTVSLDTMSPPDAADGSATDSPRLRRRDSSSSLRSVGSASSALSVFSLNSSHSGISSSSRRPSVASSASSMRRPSPGVSEWPAARKRRSRASLRSTSTSRKDRLGVWDNITRWTRVARQVLAEIDRVAQLPDKEREAAAAAVESDSVYLSSPSQLLAFRERFDIDAFEAEVGRYRSWIARQERERGRSRTIFGHNDTQYGNVLLEVDDVEPDAKREVPDNRAPHESIIVIDVRLPLPVFWIDSMN
jgi:choline kinase